MSTEQRILNATKPTYRETNMHDDVQEVYDCLYNFFSCGGTETSFSTFESLVDGPVHATASALRGELSSEFELSLPKANDRDTMFAYGNLVAVTAWEAGRDDREAREGENDVPA